MKNIYTLSLLGLLTLVGCSSDENAKYVESGGAQTIISTNKINIADWNNAAITLVNEMIASGVFERIPEKKPIRLVVSRIVNRTSENIDTDMLTKKIEITLTNTGKALIVSTDPTTHTVAQAQAKANGVALPSPKITLTGKILEDREKNSSMREVTYTFQLELNYAGAAAWIGEKQITKQQSHSSWGL